MNFMNSTATYNSGPRRLPVLWVEEPALGPLFLRRRALGRSRQAWAFTPIRIATGASFTQQVRPVGRRSCGAFSRGISPAGASSYRASPRIGAFTLLEMIVVLAIIGFVAAIALPHVPGLKKANTEAAADRQLLDDLAFARQRALANRSTVYMVFVPPNFWNNEVYKNETNNVFTPPYSGQYTSYALLALNSVGDQPGQHFAHYLTDWRTLPQGVYISEFEFSSSNIAQPPTNIYTTNTTVNLVVTNTVYPFNWTWTVPVPFPSVLAGRSNNLPYIGFSPQGTLTAQADQYIVLKRGSVFYPQSSNGAYMAVSATPIATPPGNDTSSPNMIHIDWLTARANVVQNQF
jgi:prepilin-type N-terminal cleavage/methylation domain-containing protein